MTPQKCSQWLIDISNDVRSAGDVPLIKLSEDGVTPQALTLADELWLVSQAVLNLDPAPAVGDAP